MGKKYKIKVEYSTGNSYGSEDTESFIDLEWDNLDIAKENLQAIKEHWGFYREYGGHWFSNHKEKKDYSGKWWYPEIDGVIGADNIHHCMKLKADNGKTMQQWNFWCGYFEYLIGAEIVTDESDTKFTV